MKPLSGPCCSQLGKMTAHLHHMLLLSQKAALKRGTGVLCNQIVHEHKISDQRSVPKKEARACPLMSIACHRR